MKQTFHAKIERVVLAGNVYTGRTNATSTAQACDALIIAVEQLAYLGCGAGVHGIIRTSTAGCRLERRAAAAHGGVLMSLDRCLLRVFLSLAIKLVIRGLQLSCMSCAMHVAC